MKKSTLFEDIGRTIDEKMIVRRFSQSGYNYEYVLGPVSIRCNMRTGHKKWPYTVYFGHIEVDKRFIHVLSGSFGPDGSQEFDYTEIIKEFHKILSDPREIANDLRRKVTSGVLRADAAAKEANDLKRAADKLFLEYDL